MLTEAQIADALRASNEEFRELEAAHHRLEAELQEILKHRVQTPQEEMMKKQLQKEKLAAKDKMAELIRQYRGSQGHAAAH